MVLTKNEVVLTSGSSLGAPNGVGIINRRFYSLVSARPEAAGISYPWVYANSANNNCTSQSVPSNRILAIK